MRLHYLALVSSEPDAACEVLGRNLALPRRDLDSVPAFTAGEVALLVVPPGHPLVGEEAKPGVHHAGFAVERLEPPAGIPAERIAGLDGRRALRLERDAMLGVRAVLTEPLEFAPPAPGLVERIDHVGVASTDVAEDEALYAGRLGFAVESRQTDMKVHTAIETFTSDKYGIVTHARKPEAAGGLRVCFVTVGDCEFEFLANFDPRQGGSIEHGRAGSTRQDQGAIARFVASRGRGLHHVALKVTDIGAALSKLAAAGRPMIDAVGRPGSRRALIGFPHPRALGGVLIHFVERQG